MFFMIWRASVDRVVNVQCYMICVVYGGLVFFMIWRASVDRVVNAQGYMVSVVTMVQWT